MLRRSISSPGGRRTAACQHPQLPVACFAQSNNADGRGHSSSGGRDAGAPKHSLQLPQESDDEDMRSSTAQHIHVAEQPEQRRPAPQRQQRSAPLQRQQQQQPARRRAAPVQRGRPQPMLAGARQGASHKAAGRGGSAPRGRAWQRTQRVQRNVKKEAVISLREWLLDAAKNTRQGGAPPKVLVSVASSLRRVAADELKESTANDVTTHDGDVSVPNVESALQKLHALVKSALQAQRLDLSVFVWAVSEGLEAHPALHAAAASSGNFVASIEAALVAAAQADTTYEDARRVCPGGGGAAAAGHHLHAVLARAPAQA